MVGSFDTELVRADQATDLPPSALPTREVLPVGATIRCTVLIPAHNEEAILGLTLDSLAEQTRRPDHVIVVADNCTDGTVAVAAAHGVDVVETVENDEKKAGALNQQLADCCPEPGLRTWCW